jgi:hypothetical protein
MSIWAELRVPGGRREAGGGGQQAGVVVDVGQRFAADVGQPGQALPGRKDLCWS